jgi:dTDP-4-dehydrorhamnose reductase
MDRKKVAVFGSTGQLGTDLVDLLRRVNSFEVIPLAHEDADCTDANAVRKVLLDSRPHIVINCAAYVRVDDCEDRVRDAFEVNAIGAINVARVCAELDALCVYISTDYVFDGTKDSPYVESDATSPINVYGASKLAGEHLVRQAAPRSLIVRMASLFGKSDARGKGGNFVETVIAKARAGAALQIVDDVCMSPTYTRDAAEALAGLITAGASGTVHLVNDGACSWYEFAQRTVQLAGVHADINPVSSTDYPTRARRPKNSAMRSERSFPKMRPWKDGLEAYLIERGHIGRAGDPPDSASATSAPLR